MVKKEPLDLIADIETSSDEYEQAVFGTYTFEPAFFENKILPILQKRDAENILVLIDRSEYESNFSKVKLAGKEYYLDHCKSGQVFHPKFILLTWEDGGKLIVGSANLNENEWRTAGEILVNIDYDSANPDQDSISVFWEMSQFLQALIDRRILKSKKHSQKLSEIITGTKWLSNINQPSPSDKVRLLNNIQKPIIDQILQLIKEQKVQQIDCMSPFFGEIDSIIEKFSNIGCKRLRFFIQPDKVIGFSTQNLKKVSSKVKVDVLSSHFREPEGRFNHAKILTVKTQGRSYCLTGSPNATRAALTETADVGNLELATLRVENDIHYFDYLVSPDIFELKTIDPISVPFKLPPTRKDFASTDLLLTEARLREKNLILEFEPEVKASEAMITLKHSEGKDKKILRGKIPAGNSITMELNVESFDFCSKPTSVTLELTLDDKTLVSSARWISTESLELSPRRRDVQRIKESNGRHGLIAMLNQFSQSSGSIEFLVYSLQWIDFDDLAPNIDWARRRILQRNTDSGDESELIPFDLDIFEPNQIMLKIIARHQKKLERVLKSLDSEGELEETFSRIFDLFLFLSKITIWFVQVKSDLIEELRWIWHDSIEILNTLSDLAKDYPETVCSLVRELYLLEHMITLGYFIDQLQRKQGYDRRFSFVVGFFKDVLNRAVRFGYDFGYFRDHKTSFNRFEEVAKEYKEFKNIDIDNGRLFQFFLNLSHPVQ